VNEEDVIEVAGVQVRGVTTVRRNTVWVGLDGERPLDRERRERLVEGVSAKGAKPRKRAVR
jgi:hypothetical protein